jgi:hypothetical protein
MKRIQSQRRSHRSKGEIISTFTFLLVGVFFLGEADVLWEQNEWIKSTFMLLCALACFAAGFRFHIHNLWHQIKDLLS